MENLPTTQGIVILPGSFSLGGSLFLMTAMHSSFRGIVSCASYFLLFDKISFKNLAYLGIWVTASKKGIVMSSCLNTFRTFWNCLSRVELCILWGNGKHWVFTSFGSCTFVCVFWVISGSASYSLFLGLAFGRFLPLLRVTVCACSLGFWGWLGKWPGWQKFEELAWDATWFSNDFIWVANWSILASYLLKFSSCCFRPSWTICITLLWVWMKFSIINSKWDLGLDWGAMLFY